MPFIFNPLSGTFDYYQSGSAGNSFTIWQPDHGTSPTASSSSDTMTMTSGDSSVSITGNSSTKTLDLRIALQRSDDRPPVKAINLSSTSLPTGSSCTVDGYSVQNGDRILFTALSSGTNKAVYVASGVGTSISWTLATDGQAGDGSPTAGDTLYVINGTYNGSSRWSYTAGNVWMDGTYFEHFYISSTNATTGLTINSVPVFRYTSGSQTTTVLAGGGNGAGMYFANTTITLGADNAAVVPHVICSPDNYADMGSADGGSTLKRFRDLYLARNIRAAGNLGVGNSASASTLGTVVKKIEVFDASGNSLGFIPVYNSIT